MPVAEPLLLVSAGSVGGLGALSRARCIACCLCGLFAIHYSWQHGRRLLPTRSCASGANVEPFAGFAWFRRAVQ